ncbi:DUF397 domain-containing protein [Kitasatospora sp. NPDC058190]
MEVALESLPGAVPVRDSKDPNGPILLFSTSAWESFVSGVQTGDFQP